MWGGLASKGLTDRVLRTPRQRALVRGVEPDTAVEGTELCSSICHMVAICLLHTYSLAEWRTGVRLHLLVGCTAAVLAALLPLDGVADMVNIGTLFAVPIVAVAVIVLRRTRPDLPRGLRVPWAPVVPVLS